MNPQSHPKKKPKDFMARLIDNQDGLRDRINQGNPREVIRAELDDPDAQRLPDDLFPPPGTQLPAPDEITKVVRAMERGGFFPGKGQDLSAIICVVQPAFPLIAEGDAAD